MFLSQADKLNEECGIVGIYAPKRDAARLAYFGLHALQHRGQESAGIAVADGASVSVYKNLGLVSQVFSEESLQSLQGDIATGHVRYSTSGSKGSSITAQPHIGTIDQTLIALSHNGTLINTNEIKVKLVELGINLQTETDSEMAAKIISHFTIETGHVTLGIKKAMEFISGAYAMCVITNTALYAFRDPNGLRPLALGKLPATSDKANGWVLASESCAFDIMGAEYVGEIKPGEVIRITGSDETDITYTQGVPARRRGACIFEYVYFARPDSYLDTLCVGTARDKMGRILSHEAPVQADVVIGVPDSGIPSAIGYARESGIPYSEGIIKNRYVGRTFIQPTQEMRQQGIRIKLNPLSPALKDKRIIVIDDSIVRGNTSKQLVSMLYQAGAREVHVRIVSPPVVWPCFFGIDTATQDQLIAASHSVAEIEQFLECDSLAFLSLEGLFESVAKAKHSGFCAACFNGDYPLQLPLEQYPKAFSDGNEPTYWDDKHATSTRLF